MGDNLNVDVEAIKTLLKEHDLSDMINQFDGVEGHVADQAKIEADLMFDDMFRTLDKESAFIDKQVSRVFVQLFDAFFVGLRTVLAPLWVQLGTLDAGRQIATQTAFRELRPTPNDIGTTLNFMFKTPDEQAEGIENLRVQGYSEDRIKQILIAGQKELNDLEVAELWRRGEIDDNQNKELLKKLGFIDKSIELKSKHYNTLLDLNSVRNLYLRDEIDEQETLSKINSLGYNKVDSENVLKLFFFIPPVQDLIRMSVREVFSPDIAARFGQFDDFPKEFESQAKKQGISPEWARNYWAAHWELPSISMGFEMLHRRVIAQDDLNLLLRAHDVMPFWRDKLTEISYKPITRVDVRRMYRIGVLDREAVYDAYLNIGYDSNNAELMTQFTEIDSLASERDLSKTEILSSFELQTISIDEAFDMLSSLGYDSNETQLLINQRKYKRENRLRTKHINASKKLFKAGIKSESDTVNGLASLGVRPDETKAYLEEWKADIVEDVKTLTLDDLKGLVKLKIIDQKTFTVRTRHMNYNDEDIAYLFQLALKGK